MVSFIKYAYNYFELLLISDNDFYDHSLVTWPSYHNKIIGVNQLLHHFLNAVIYFTFN